MAVSVPAFVASCVVTGLVVQLLYKWISHRRFFAKLPGPPHSFLYGHMGVMMQVARSLPHNTHPQAYYTEIARRYSLEGLFYLDLWPFVPCCLVLTDPSLLEYVSTKHPLPQHPLGDQVMAPVVGKGVIITANGPLWKKLRAIMTPAFSWKHIRDMTPIMVEECILFRDALEKRAGTGRPFSMMDLGARLIFDIIARAVFNFPLHAQTTGCQYLDDLHEMIHLAEGQLNDPAVAFNPVTRIKVWWRRRTIINSLNPSMMAKVRERLQLLRTRGIVPSRTDPTSILDLMLREHVLADQAEQKKDKPDYNIPDKDMQLILTNLKGALVGGHGTTVDTFCYMLMLLTKDPKMMAKMRQEHDEVFSPDHETTKQMLLANPEKLQEIPYTDAIIRETLRLFPVGIPLRSAEEGSTIPYKGTEYPLGDSRFVIVLNGHDLHYNSNYFPSAASFKPERWLDDQNQVPRSYFRTFSRGARACLGMNLAINELKVVLIMVIRDFDFRCADLKPNLQAKTSYTTLDTEFGDVIFQEVGLEAKPRGPMMMLTKKRKAE